jgi:mannose-1-phosphate guanylyltransferase
VLARVWPGLTRIAIDHAIAEPVAAAGGVAVVPGDFDWDDVGDFASLAGLVAAAMSGGVDGTGDGDGSGDTDGDGRAGPTLGDPAVVLRAGSPNAFVVTGAARVVSVVGVPDAVVVDTPDALLVTTRAHSQDVKAAVDAWRARGRDDLL